MIFLIFADRYSIQRVVIFVTTHATPEGWLHHTVKNKGAGTVEEVSVLFIKIYYFYNIPQVMPVLLPDNFRMVLKTLDTTLFFFTCGGGVSDEASFKLMNNIVHKEQVL